jgi:hypothetical protein
MTILPAPAYAHEYSIPVNGRFGNSRIALAIPSTPKWAHDIVLNASLAWNNAQLWYQHSYSPDGNVFKYVESSPANATVNFALPTLCSGFAVGWTEYALAQSSNTILSARIFLDQTVFNANQENNVTARHYAFWLALHELGRALGLGSVLDGHDIMDPMGAPNRVSEQPMLSTLDLFAVHVLASESRYTSPIVLNTDQYQLLNAWNFINATATNKTPVVDSSFWNALPNQVSHRPLSDAGETIDALSQKRSQSQMFFIATVLFAVFVTLGMLLRRRSRQSTPRATKSQYRATMYPVPFEPQGNSVPTSQDWIDSWWSREP